MSQPQEVHTLICHHDVDMALICLGSLVKNCSDSLKIIFHDDGTLTSNDTKKLEASFGNASIISKKEADELMTASLSKYPKCQEFRRKNIMALKILDIPIMSDSKIAYCDSDIFFLRPFRNIFEFPSNKVCAVFMQDNKDAYSFKLNRIYFNIEVKILRSINAGLFIFNSNYYDIDYVEWLLLKLNDSKPNIWIEQTCWAALAARCETRIWDPELVCVISEKTNLPNGLVAGHFTRPVRNKLFDVVNKPMASMLFNHQSIGTIPSDKVRLINIVLRKIINKITGVLN
jgi:hypothetical protein